MRVTAQWRTLQVRGTALGAPQMESAMSLNLKVWLTPPAPATDQVPEHKPDPAAPGRVATVLRRLSVWGAHLRAIPGVPRVEDARPGVFGLLAGSGERLEK